MAFGQMHLSLKSPKHPEHTAENTTTTPTSTVKNVGQSKQRQIPFGYLLKNKTVWTVSPRNQI